MDNEPKLEKFYRFLPNAPWWSLKQHVHSFL